MPCSRRQKKVIKHTGNNISSVEYNEETSHGNPEVLFDSDAPCSTILSSTLKTIISYTNYIRLHEIKKLFSIFELRTSLIINGKIFSKQDIS